MNTNATNRFAHLAELAAGWCVEDALSYRERTQALVIAKISRMLHENRFPADSDVGILNHLVCKLCSRPKGTGPCHGGCDDKKCALCCPGLAGQQLPLFPLGDSTESAPS